MATFNLSRNTRVFMTQNVDATTGVIPSSGSGITNTGATRTTEITVLDGLSFSQASQSTTVSLNEAGSSSVRGQRSFNTALDPVEFSFSTYLGPNGTTTVDFAERVLWSALVSTVGIDLSYAITVTSMTRSASTAALVTIVSSAYSFTGTLGANVGDVIQITAGSGAPTTSFQYWSGPVKIVSFSPSGSASTTTVVEYLTPPAVAAGTSATIPTSVLLYKGGYFRSISSTTSEAYAEVNTANSDKNQLIKFGMFFQVDGAVYAIDNCVIESASVDFSIDGIATVAWTGKGSALRNLSSATISSATPAVFAGTGIPTGTAATALAVSHLTNKLSVLSLSSNIQGGGTTYSVPITGGNITITNNATYLTPAALRTVNTPINYFLGARSITGSLSAYLRTGSGNTAQLLTDIIAAGTEPKFALVIDVNGATGKRVEFILNGAMLQVPSIETADIVTTTIGFTAQGYDPLAATNAYDMERTNDLVIRAYGQ